MNAFWTPLLAGTWLALALASAATARPYVPASGDEVVARLPFRLDAAERARRAALARHPGQLPLALATAQQAVARARRDGDPRELGTAQAALAPWWHDTDAPAPVRLLRATILQSRHDFDAALADLDRLAGEPQLPAALRAQVLVTRASLQQLRGRFDAARLDCRALQQPAFAALGDRVRRAADACALELDSLTGDPRQARRGFDALLDAGGDPWVQLLRAEWAARVGDDTVARRSFESACAGGEVYPLAVFADWLLDRGRAGDALAVLERGPEQADALVLRRAIAWQRLGDARAVPARHALKERFAAARLRADAPHLYEEARLALDLDHDAARALALARRQWERQREPADAVLLWRAAQAAGRPEAAGPLWDWLPDPARADVRLAGLPRPAGRRP